MLVKAIEVKEKLVQEMENQIFVKLPAEYKNFEFLYKKELEINNKIKQDLAQKGVIKKDFSNYIKNLLQVCKEISMLSISRIENAYFKINFNGLAKQPTIQEVYVILQVLVEYRLVEVCENINLKHLAEELAINKNFTLFFTNLANEFIKYLSK
jgi:hypothetical protein